MSKIRLVVEIDEERYKSICDVVEKAKKVNVPSWYAHKIIANGIPLDNLRAEIEKERVEIHTIAFKGEYNNLFDDGRHNGLLKALEIIDKYRNEVSE